MRSYLVISLLPFIGLAFAPCAARAYILPYTVRTQDFSSWTPATQGDTNTVGMAGATVALPMSISSSEPNPAGYAMTMGAVSAQINNTGSNDLRLQKSGETVQSGQWGFGVSPKRWGIGISYYSPQTETGTYVSPVTGDTVRSEVSLKEFRLVLARAFLRDSRLAVGLGLELVKAVRELNDAATNAWGPSFRVGVLYRLPNHVLLAVSYAPQIRVGAGGDSDNQARYMPGFNRAVVRPALATVGTGWIPNRFFKFGLSLTAVGSTQNTALFYDQTITTGNSATWVPRMGASYVVAEYPSFKIDVASGIYYESSRLSNQSDRFHVTAGLEVNPSFINLGGGFDVSSGYRNYMFTAGIDIVRTARVFNIIPREELPPYRGFFPSVKRLSPDGLPAGLTANEPKKHGDQSVEDVGEIIMDVPDNLMKKASGERTSVEASGKAQTVLPRQ